MQRLIERRMLDDMAGEPYVKIITTETKAAIKSHDQARKFGRSVKASLVVWGEVISLRGEIEFQAYITAVDPVKKYRDNSLDNYIIDLSMADQITLRQTHADDVVSVALTQAAQFIGRPLKGHEKALEIFDKISHPTYRSLCAEASMAVLAKKSTRAQTLIDSAIAKEPESPHAYYVLGFYHQDRQEWDQAIIAFQRMLQLDPENTGAFDGLASVYRALGDYPTAIEFSQKAVEGNPSSYYYIGHLGFGYFGNKQYDLAIQHLKRAMELRANHPQLPYTLADVYLTIGNYEEALRYFNKALQVDPQYRWTHDMRGLVYIHLGKYRKAIRAYNKSITFEPNDHRHYHGLAAAQIAKRNYQQAVQALERAVALKKNDAYGRILLYLSFSAAEQPDKARAHLDTLRANSDQSAGKICRPLQCKTIY